MAPLSVLCAIKLSLSCLKCSKIQASSAPPTASANPCKQDGATTKNADASSRHDSILQSRTAPKAAARKEPRGVRANARAKVASAPCARLARSRKRCGDGRVEASQDGLATRPESYIRRCGSTLGRARMRCCSKMGQGKRDRSHAPGEWGACEMQEITAHVCGGRRRCGLLIVRAGWSKYS